MKYEQLWHLLGAYYHEDFEGVWETFDLYLTESSNAVVLALAAEIDSLLAETPTSAVPKATWDLGSAVWLAEEPEPYVEWLSEMRTRALAHTGTEADGPRTA